MSFQDSVIVIGIAGGTASGKSTISTAIVDSVGEDNLSHLLHDDYYKNLADIPRLDDRAEANFDHPDALDTPLLLQHIQTLKAGLPVQVPVYDFVHFMRTDETHTVEPRPVVIVEGILTLAEASLRQVFDIKIFVDTPADLRFIRRLQRDIAQRGRTMDSVIAQYLSTVRPMHLAFVEPSKVYADLIIPQGGFNTVAVDVVADSLRALLARTGLASARRN